MGDSMSSVVLSGDSSGTVTLTVPSAAGTNTATLPAATGTVMVSGNQPAFSVYMTGNQSVSNNTWTKATMNTEEFDTNNYFDSSTNYRFTPLIAGYYQISGAIYLTNSSGNISTPNIAIYKNGSSYKRGSFQLASANTDSISVVSALVYLNGSTDYIELWGFIGGSSTSPVFAANSTYSYFTGCMVRSA